jgi:tRNA(adenine34) deaminase
MNSKSDDSFSHKIMREALAEAEKAFQAGEVPVGAILVREGRVIAGAHNTRECDKDPLNHAEIKVLKAGARELGDWRLGDCELYVTLEPCPMCLGALFQARVGKLIFGCFDEKRSLSRVSSERNAFPSLEERLRGQAAPVLISSNNHNLLIEGGVCEEAAAELLRRFFRGCRK